MTTTLLSVDLSLRSSLDFAALINQAENAEKILWQLDLDVFSHPHAFHFEGIFNAHYLSLQSFVDVLWKPFSHKSKGCLLFKGSCDLSSSFVWIDGYFQLFLEWLEDLYATPEKLFDTQLEHKSFSEMPLASFDTHPFCKHLKNLYAMNLLIGYLHRLAAALPEEVEVYVDLDKEPIVHKAYLAQLLSQERFAHLLHLDESVDEEVNVGICLPNDSECTQATMHAIKQAFAKLDRSSIKYKVIPEFLLTSMWEGLDVIIYMKKSLSLQGKRMLQGFSSTGGELVYIDESAGIELECSLEEFLEKKSG